jgi:hypothetical protein
MSGRVYSAQFNGQAATAQVDFFELVAASTKAVELLAVHLSNLSEVKDIEEEMLLVMIKAGSTTTGSGGATPTPVPRHLGDSAFAGTVKTMNTTKATAGTIVTHHAQNWNIRAPLDIVFIPDATIWLPPSARLTVELGTTPADSITFAGTMLFREVG